MDRKRGGDQRLLEVAANSGVSSTRLSWPRDENYAYSVIRVSLSR